MKWTKAQEDKLMKLIADHKHDGYPDAEIYRLISKTMKRTPNALRHKHGSIKAELMQAEFVDHMASLDGDLADFDGAYENALYKQRIGRALRKVDQLIVLDFEAGAVNYIGGNARSDKPKTFIEKIKEFFKGGNNE
jgi:hypothetical protein